MTKEYTIKIEQDELCESPREWDNLGVMVCFHRRYILGDTEHGYDPEYFNSWDELYEEIERKEDPVVILPLYMLDHSGITIRCGSEAFQACDPAGWDWGQIGFIFARKKDVLKEWNRKKISPKLRKQVRELLRSEVKVYDQYVTGDVWWYGIEDEEGENVDTCGGFYGYEECEKEAKSVVERLKLEDAKREYTPGYLVI
jgi:hypothetical protein